MVRWAEYGYCASHSRYFWCLRLHLVCTVHGLVLGWRLAGAKADEREVLTDLIATGPLRGRTSQCRPVVIGDKNYYGEAFEARPQPDRHHPATAHQQRRTSPAR